MIDPTYLISTSIGFNTPFVMLVNSMQKAGIHKWKSFEGNSFDYTAIIAVLAGNVDVGSHVVLLHATMEVTPETPGLIETADPESGAVAAFGGQCNLGLYRMDYLQTRRDEIIALKDCSKGDAIRFEGRLWRECPTHTNFADSDCIPMGIERPYGGAERMREFYPGMGIMKLKSNWGQTSIHGNYALVP